MKSIHLALMLLIFCYSNLKAGTLTKFSVPGQYLSDEYEIIASDNHKTNFKANITISRSLKSYGYEKLNWIVTIVANDNYRDPISTPILITEADFLNNSASIDLTIDCNMNVGDMQIRVQMSSVNYDDLGNIINTWRTTWTSRTAYYSAPTSLINDPVFNSANARLYSSYAPNSNFRKSDYITGAAITFGQSEWANVQGITSLNGSLYVVQANNLHRVNPSDGSYVLLGEEQIWKNTEAIASSSNGSIYIIQNSRIHKVNPATGSFSIIGNAEWGGTDCFVAYNGYLYIVENDHLYKVNEETGSYIELNDASWGGAMGIASTNDGYIWIIQNKHLHRVNASTGEWEASLGQEWWSTPKGCLTFYNGNLYAIRNQYLVKISTHYLSWDEISEYPHSGSSYLTALQ